jgi:hypothetical protein
MRFYDWSSARSADAAKKSAVAKPSVNRSSTGANSSYASEERFWLCWKRAQLVAVLNSQARAPCARASSSDLRKSACAEIILSGSAPFKSISASARSVSAAHQTLRPCSARATTSEVRNTSESVLSRSRSKFGFDIRDKNWIARSRRPLYSSRSATSPQRKNKGKRESLTQRAKAESW